jgi:mono/diheme cytochrome c family protein
MKKVMHLAVICISLIYISVAYSAKTELNEDAIIASIMNGEGLYQTTCSVCHGDKGNADTWVSKSLNPKPKNFTDPKVIASLSRDRMFYSIYNGRSGTAMQPFRHQLSEMQITSVIDYIRSKLMKVDVFKERLKEMQPSATGKEAVKTISAAAFKEARKLYQTTCSVCHGDDGNAATWASNSLNPKPKNFTDPEVISTLSRARMIISVSNGLPGTAMQPFKHQLSDVQIAGIVDYIWTNIMHVKVRKGKKKVTSP